MGILRNAFLAGAAGSLAALVGAQAAVAQTTLPSVTVVTPKPKAKAPSPKPVRRVAVKTPASTSPTPRLGPRPDTQLAISAASGTRAVPATLGVETPAGTTGAEGGTGGGPVSPALAAAKASEARAEQARERIFAQGGASVEHQSARDGGGGVQPGDDGTGLRRGGVAVGGYHHGAS